MDFIESVFIWATKLGIFLYFGLPVIIGTVIFTISVFQSLIEERLNRKKYFFHSLWTTTLFVVAGIAIASNKLPTLALILVGFAVWALFIFLLSLEVRRLHDLNYSGWIAALMCIISCILHFFDISLLDNIYLVIYIPYKIMLLFFKGTVGDNKYGSNPLESRGGAL